MNADSDLIAPIVLAPDFLHATFSGPTRAPTSCPWRRVTLRPVEIRGRRHVQFSYFDAKKHIAKNFEGAALTPALDELVAFRFAGIHLQTASEEIDIRTTKKGAVHVGRRAATSSPAPLQPHNRGKDVPLPEGQANRLLEVMGILTHTGQVRPTMRAKFTQINEFLKQLVHVLDHARLNDLGRPLAILDAGCGLSYLTLAVHYYLNEVLHLPARIQGVDVNEEVIRKSIERSRRLDANGPDFACAPIDAALGQPDIVLALHACDTATDDALAHAINAEARVVLCVPCCHHHLNDRITAEVLRPILRHGILRQRTADIVTDAFRALLLRIHGYRTEVVEFISTEHTARNLMIRAVRTVPSRDPALLHEYQAMCDFWQVTPYLAGLLKSANGDPAPTPLSTDTPGERVRG